MRVNVIKMQGKNYDEFYGNGRQLNKEYNKYAISMEKLKIFHSFNRLDGFHNGFNKKQNPKFVIKLQIS